MLRIKTIMYITYVWCNISTRANGATLLRFLDHTQLHTHTHVRTPMNKWSPSGRVLLPTQQTNTRFVPKLMSKFFLHANWEQLAKESAVVDGTSCRVILECLVTSIACIT